MEPGKSVGARTRVKLHEGQIRVVRHFAADGPIRHCIIAGGWQSGKTFLLHYVFATSLFRTHDAEYVVVLPDFSRTSMLIGRVNSVVRRLGGPSHWILPRGSALGPHEYVDRNGNRIYIGSAARPITIEGPSARLVIVDEGHEVSARAWEAAISRISASGGRILGACLPIHGSWPHSAYEHVLSTERVVARGSSPFTAYVTTESWHFEFWASALMIRRADWQRTLTRLPRSLLDALYGLARSWAVPQHVVFDGFSVVRNVTSDVPGTFERIWLGVDFGYIMPTAVLFIGLHGETVYVFDAIYAVRQDFATQIVPMIRERLTQHLPVFEIAWCDPSRPDLIATLNAAGIRAAGAPNAYHPGLDVLNALFHSGTLRIASHCTDVIRELMAYRYPERKGSAGGGRGAELPEKRDDHCPDALRYWANGAMAWIRYTWPGLLGIERAPAGRRRIVTGASEIVTP